VSEDEGGVDFDLPPEIASADISIAREFLCYTFYTALCLSRTARLTLHLARLRVAELRCIPAPYCTVSVKAYRALSRNRGFHSRPPVQSRQIIYT
jgi:hypothetical protein